MKKLNDGRRARRAAFLKKYNIPYDNGHRENNQCFGANCGKQLDYQKLIKNPYLSFCDACTILHQEVGFRHLIETTTT
jgi:hypothetical protein